MPDQQPDHRRYEQAKDILQRVLELTPGARSAYLATACGEDAALRAEVESLLSAHDDVNSSFLDSPLAFLNAEPEPETEEIDLAGRRVGAYRLERLLGRGGMGSVYLATRVDGEFTKHVAIKFIRTSRVSPAALKRFKAERQILADIDHPKIARLIDGGSAEGMPFFIMEYVAGDTLAQAIEQGPLPIDRATKLAVGVAEVLEAIHGKGLVFRDLKPSNIILNEQTGVKVLDFGIAKLIQPDTGEESTHTSLTGPGFIVGSPRYMSPEQASGEMVDARSDVFSFGLVIFEALTGRLPFSGESRKDYFKSLMSGEPEALPASVPAKLRAIIDRCLNKDPSARFRTGHELAEAVRAMATPPGRVLATRAGIALLVIALVAGGFAIWSATRPRETESVLLDAAPTSVVAWPTNESNPRISPDLKWTSFLSDRDGVPKIWLKSRPPGNERSIPPIAGNPRGNHEWSPASDRIAYVTAAGAAWKLIITPVDGGTPLAYDLPQQDVSLVRWRKGGVYYLAGGALWRFDFNAGRPIEVSTARKKTHLRSVDVTPDEQNIVYSAFEDGMGRVFYSAIDASRPTRLTDERLNPRYVRWKGDSARDVVFIGTVSEIFDIFQLTIANRQPQRLTWSDVKEGGLDVSSDGGILVYEQTSEQSHLASLMPGASSVPKRVTFDSLSDTFPATPASGPEIVFQRSKSIMTFGRDTGTIRLTRDDFATEPLVIGDGYAPEISADGRWVSYPQWQPEGLEKLWMVDLSQPGRKPWLVSSSVTRSGFLQFPSTVLESIQAWAGPTPRLFFRATDEVTRAKEIWSVEPGPDRPVAKERVASIGEPAAVITDLRASVDGSRISYVLGSRPTGDELRVVDLTRKSESVEFVDSTGGRLACLGWLPDGSIVLLRENKEKTATDVIVVANGRPREVSRLKDLEWGSAALGPRQRTMYFTRDVGLVRSLHALPLDAGGRSGERILYASEPNGPALSGLRVLQSGLLLFAQQTENTDILSNRFRK